MPASCAAALRNRQSEIAPVAVKRIGQLDLTSISPAALLYRTEQALYHGVFLRDSRKFRHRWRGNPLLLSQFRARWSQNRTERKIS